MPPARESIQELWSPVERIWSDLDRLTRFTLLDIVLHLVMGRGTLVSVDRLALLLAREEDLAHRAVDRLVVIGLAEERGMIQNQRYISVNRRHEMFPSLEKLFSSLTRAREIQVEFMRLLSDENRLRTA